MNVIKVTPRGYCQGVVKALNIVEKTIADHPNKPIYLLGMIVHNDLIHQALKNKIKLLDNSKTKQQWIEEINEGILISSAHGISPELRQRIQQKGLFLVDATCKYVSQTHEIVKEYLSKGYEVLYIGKENHPEAMGVQGIDNNKIHLVTTIDNIKKDIQSPIMVTTQTTMNYKSVSNFFSEIKNIYPNAIILDEICDATSLRQNAIINLPPVDMLFVVGDKNSNNANKLVELGIAKNIKKVLLINSVVDIELNVSDANKTVAVTSAASTPTYLTKQVIDYLENFPNSKKPPIDLNKII